MRNRIGVLLGLFLLAVSVTAQAQDDFDYTTNAAAITITGYYGPGGDVSIPAVINGLPVTSIGYEAFSPLYDLTNSAISGSVTIPSSVTNIAGYAFYECGMTGVTIPCSVTDIQPDTFLFCTSLTNVAIPDSVTNIGLFAFAYCSSLTNVTIGYSVTNIGERAFQDCISLTNVFFEGNAPTVDILVFSADLLASSVDPATIYYLPGTIGWSYAFWGFPAGPPAVLWDPLIQTGDGSFGISNNQFGFNIINGSTNNIPIVVEACTNLVSPIWTPLQSLTLANKFYFSEPLQTNSSARFYRVSSP